MPRMTAGSDETDLLGTDGDKINALLAAAGHNLRLVLDAPGPSFGRIHQHCRRVDDENRPDADR